MNNVINESKKQPKVNAVFNEINNFSSNYKTLEQENQSIKKEVKSLKTKNQNLENENSRLLNLISNILDTIKDFFRHLLKIGNEPIKEYTVNEIKDYYDNKAFNSDDIYDISKGTTKEDELFDYANLLSYLKTPKKSSKDKDDFDLER